MILEEDPEVIKWMQGEPLPREEIVHLLQLAARRGRYKGRGLRSVPTDELVKMTLWSYNMQERSLAEIVGHGVPPELAKDLIKDARRMGMKASDESDQPLNIKLAKLAGTGAAYAQHYLKKLIARILRGKETT